MLVAASVLHAPLVRADADSSAQLAAVYAASTERLRNNPFKRPLYLESAEAKGTLKGEIFAVVDHPFAKVNSALGSPVQWCEVLLLHPNIAQCRPGEGGGALVINLARRFDQPIEGTQRADFAFAVEQASADYLSVRLDAKKGPVGTSDYRIVLEAMPVEGGKTFLHFAYSYSYGLTARLATQAYLSSKGSGKVGFTATGKGPDGEPRLIGGLRGAVERNAMRYYLAIDAYLGTLQMAPAERFEKSLQAWFDSIEQYPRQLKEDDRAAYVAVKRGQHQRQVAAG